MKKHHDTGQSSTAKDCYLVAVSGGVDSVVLLDVLYRHGLRNIIVAHVDHGIRPDSADDARFVEKLADRYGIAFESVRLELGAGASEEVARRERYDFLRTVAKKHRAHIVTAHHADDVVETVAINLARGTGWRGLAVFGAHDVYRPMTGWFKREVLAYAEAHRLEWCEDSTNQSGVYLRNRIRARVAAMPEQQKLQLLELWRAQSALRQHITEESRRFASTRRYTYIMTPTSVASEILRSTLNMSLTRPQATRALMAIKTARPGALCDLDGKTILRFGSSDFSLIRRKK